LRIHGVIMMRKIAEALLGRSSGFVEHMIDKWIEDLRKNPNDYETWAALGSAYGKLHRYGEAVTSFEKAIAVNPKYAEAYLGLASSYGFLGRMQDKIAACKHAVELKPDYAEAHATLGAAYGKAGQHADAIRALREALRIEPKFHYARYTLGVAYLTSGDITAAVREADTLGLVHPPLGRELRDLITKWRNARWHVHLFATFPNLGIHRLMSPPHEKRAEAISFLVGGYQWNFRDHRCL
jgi:tetratricopeptide (TPR) repeat protein